MKINCQKCNQSIEKRWRIKNGSGKDEFYCPDCMFKYCFKGYGLTRYAEAYDKRLGMWIQHIEDTNSSCQSGSCNHKPEDMVGGMPQSINCEECNKEIKAGEAVVHLEYLWDWSQLKHVEGEKEVCVACWLAGEKTKYALYCRATRYDYWGGEWEKALNKMIMRSESGYSPPKDNNDNNRERERERAKLPNSASELLN